jgi:transaldolase
MGASFRNMGEIVELAGCDLLTIAPPLLAELDKADEHLERKLDPARAKASSVERIGMDEATFRAMHAADKMASEKLEEGILGFSKAAVAVEKLLAERLRAMSGRARVGEAARAFFGAYDFDRDGFITREEWGGSSAVFDALDTNSDGRISVEEMAAGLGAAHCLQVRVSG